MGFLTGHTNTFEVYLTDRGREAFVKNTYPGGLSGFNDAIAYFSVSDGSTNYNFFNESINTGTTFNPNKTTLQDIPTIKASGRTVNGTREVYTQIGKRGLIMDNTEYSKPLLSVRENTMRNLVVYQPDLDGITDVIDYSYRKLNSSRHHGLSGLNGVYLKRNYTGTTVSGITNLLENYDFYPIDNFGVSRFKNKNAFFSGSTNNVLTGNNNRNRLTHNVVYSEIKKVDELVLNEKYHVEFKFYFRFYGGRGNDLQWEDYDNTGKLNVNIYVRFGTNKIQMGLDNLEQYTGGTWNSDVIKAPYATGVSGYVTNPLLEISGNTLVLNYLERTDDIELINGGNPTYNVNYTSGHFEDYLDSPNGFNFRLDASLDISNFLDDSIIYNNLCKNNKDISIIVEYSRLSESSLNYVDTFSAVGSLNQYTLNPTDEISTISLDPE